MDYFFNITGFSMLSGQAMNLNWVVTYIMHIVDPVGHYSLEYLEGLNRPIPRSYGPFFSHGLLFYLVGLIIAVKYWLLQKKDLINFLAASVIIFLSHHIVNVAAYEKHLFYPVIFMLFLYLIRPQKSNFYLLILLDLMAAINLIFFYGFTGHKDINRLFFGFDITVLFAVIYCIIYLWILIGYLRQSRNGLYQIDKHNSIR